MITKEKLDIYFKYDGDIDLFQRIGFKEKLIIESGDFSIIEETFSDIEIINNGLSSQSYQSKVMNRINIKFDAESKTIMLGKLK